MAIVASVLVVLTGVAVRPAAAAEFYVSGNLAISSADAQSSGATQFFPLGGKSSDTSPAGGGAIGFGFGLDEAMPRIGSIATPPLGFRVEVEGVTGRNYDFVTQGAPFYLSQVEQWSVMGNFWLDIPVHDPVARLAGRVPALEPLFLYGGAGIGGSHLEADSTDGFSSGSAEKTRFGWQAGAGIGYSFNDWASVLAGYRYQDLGKIDVPLAFQPGVPFGTQTLEIEANEFSATLKLDFYTAPLESLDPTRWNWPRWESPGWLSKSTRWLGSR